ncbi:LamG-like jellyroll fold domain-containing protein [Sunxiuqinia sp. sy24]|uniref:LamG-like jellyroll fold domain-containing protein n=1 Tax=Sunxiuqinia sp. sy24 TaxID=3461495 RepID=UPI004045A5E1
MKQVSKIFVGIILLLLFWEMASSNEQDVLPINIFNSQSSVPHKIETTKGKTTSPSYIFNGIDSYIEMHESFDSTFSFCAWIKPEDLLKKNMAIVGIANAFWLRTTTDRELQFTEPGVQDHNTTNLKLSNQNWIFISFIIDFPKTKIYVDAELVAEFSWVGNMKSWSQQVFVGKDNWKDNFHGAMQNIQVFKEAISQNKIKELYQLLPFEEPLTNGLVFYHSFDNQHRYFLSERQQKPQTRNIVFQNDSIKGRVASFNGKNSFIIFDELPIDNAVTISAWVKQNEFNRDFGAVAALGHAYAMRINGGGTLLFTIPQHKDLLEVNAKLTPNKWHHIALSFKETFGVTFYIDGEKKGFCPVEDFRNVSKELQIGTNLWNDFFEGQMDDLIIWNRVLNDRQIREVYSIKSNFWYKNLKVHRSKTLLYVGFVVLLVLMFLLYIRYWRQKERNVLAQDKEKSALTEEFEKVISDNLADSNFSVEQFASAMHMSKTKLYNEVKNTTGKSPKEFIREIRIIEAARLLKETTSPITEIIYETGFESRAYFNKCFKRKYNATPSNHRKKN